MADYATGIEPARLARFLHVPLKSP